MTHWTNEQTTRLAELLNAGTPVGFWCSDQHGYPSNGGGRQVRATALSRHTSDGPLQGECGGAQLHATSDPAAWRGCRVWIVALHGKTRSEGNKSWSLERETIGEVLPQEAILARVALRVGVLNLSFADLRSANLSSANLRFADLSFANLRFADLSFANLSSADLSFANLRFADLRFANLSFADLSSANLSSADLRFANLRFADLSSADLSSADLSSADLSSADLSSADLRFADLPPRIVAYCNRNTVWPEGFDVATRVVAP